MMENTSTETNPLETSDSSAAPVSTPPSTESLLKTTLDDFVTNWTGLKRSDSDTEIGTHIATSTRLNAGFAVIWYAPESSSYALNKGMIERCKWLRNHLEKVITANAFNGSSVLTSDREETDI